MPLGDTDRHCNALVCAIFNTEPAEVVCECVLVHHKADQTELITPRSIQAAVASNNTSLLTHCLIPEAQNEIDLTWVNFLCVLVWVCEGAMWGCVCIQGSKHC